jgi:hypothetical protein
VEKLTPNGFTLLPAYGKDYKSKAEVIAALNEPRDFSVRHYTGQETYCSVSDLADGEWTVRYKRLTQICIVIVKDGKAVKAK